MGHRIGIRLSAVMVWALALSAPAGDIVLVKGTSSTPDAAERGYAEAMARIMARRLTELGIRFRAADDERVAQGDLSGASVAILPYNPFPPAAEQKALARFVRQKGKLMVFYSADPALAALLDMKLGAYKAQDAGGKWSALHFNAKAPPGVPDRVRQESRNIRPVYPLAGKGQVIAEWETSEGAPVGDPAWVRSGKGLWMTHVLLDDADLAAKQRMLLALLGSLEPAVWAPAVERMVQDAGTLGKSADFEGLVGVLAKRAVGRSTEPQVDRWLKQARELEGAVRQNSSGKRYPEAMAAALEMRRNLVSAWAATIDGRAGEFRAAWDHAGTGLYPGDWDRTCNLLADHGIGNLFVNILWPFEASCRNTALPPSKVFGLYGDQLSACLRAARKRGLKVHVWKVCWSVEEAPADERARLAREGRLQRTDTGEQVNWLCPSNPDNLQSEKDAIRAVLKYYPVDGIHLDYIRYRDSHCCYCPGCRQRFEARVGVRVGRWPEDARAGAMRDRYNAWRNEQITRLVRDVKAMCAGVQPAVRVSAAVYGKYPQCVGSVGQDWGSWLRDGIVDFVCPMDYTADQQVFGEWVAHQLQLPGAKGRVMPGIGVTARESRLDAVQVLDQIVTVRRLGGSGFALFDLNRVLADEVLPYLRLGATAVP